MLDIYRFDSIINIFNNKDRLGLKFKIINDKLYAFNFLLKEENRKLLEVSKINGINVSTFLDNIELNDLYSIDKMKKYGVNATNSFILTIIDDGNVFDIDIYSEVSTYNIFYKEYQLNDKLGDLSEIRIESLKSNNTMLEYASTNVKTLLILLNNMTISQNDKFVLNKLIQKSFMLNDIYNNMDNNLDMIFLSTQLLMLDNKLDFIPQNIIDLMKFVLIFDFGIDELNESNNAILTNGNIDYKKIIRMIRNCIAHSNYKVLENGNVEFYNEGKNRMNFTIKKIHLMSLFNHLYNYYFLEGALPVILDNDSVFNRTPFTKESLINYLNGIELIGVDNIKLKIFKSPEEQKIMDNDLGLDIYFFNSIKKLGKSQVLSNNSLKRHLCVDELDSKRLTEEDIQYIINSIDEMNSDYFYKLSRGSQIEVINNLIFKKYNKDYYLQKTLQKIININNISNSGLVEHASDYINYKSKMELIMLSLINNLLLFCYNQNKFTIKVETVRFPKQVYEDYLNEKKELFYMMNKEISNYRSDYILLLKIAASKFLIPDKSFKNIEYNISKKENQLIKLKKQILCVSEILNGTANKYDYNNVNMDIFNKIRNCLAHGKLRIEISKLNDIAETNLKITDNYDENSKFSTLISFGDLIEVLNNYEFLESLLNNNQHFKKINK